MRARRRPPHAARIQRRGEIVGNLHLALGRVEIDGCLDGIPDLHSELGSGRLRQADEILAAHDAEPEARLSVADAHDDRCALSSAELVDLRLGEFDGRRRAVGGKRRAHVQRHAGMMPHRRARREGQLNGLRSRLSALWPAATVANDV